MDPQEELNDLLNTEEESEDSELEDSLDDSEELEQTESEEEEESEPNEVETLREEIERLKGDRSAIDDLKRTVGRIQSLEARLQSVEDSGQRDDLVEQVNQQFGGVHELLATVVSNMDETSLDDGTKRRVLEAYEQSRKAADKASLRKEIVQELQGNQRNTRQEEVTQQTNTDAQRLLEYEDAIVKRLEKNGLDVDKDFDWTRAAQTLKTGGGLSDLLDMADQVIDDATNARSRQAAKKQAGRGSPGAVGNSTTFDERLNKAADDNVDEGISLLRDLGLNI